MGGRSVVTGALGGQGQWYLTLQPDLLAPRAGSDHPGQHRLVAVLAHERTRFGIWRRLAPIKFEPMRLADHGAAGDAAADCESNLRGGPALGAEACTAFPCEPWTIGTAYTTSLLGTPPSAGATAPGRPTCAIPATAPRWTRRAPLLPAICVSQRFHSRNYRRKPTTAQ